jgi:hypothetical protein
MANERNARRWTRSVRLILEESGGEIRLISRETVNMMPPPAPVIPERGQSGVWAELRTRDEKPVYHQILAQLSVPGMEVFSNDPKEGIRRVDSDRPRTVVLIVPDTDEARALVIMGPADPRAGNRMAADPISGASDEIARFDLSDEGGRQ